MMCGSALGAGSRISRAEQGAGTAAVEFALLASLFMIIVAGTADFGYWIYAASELTAAVSAGSQYAANNGAMVATNPSGLATAISTIVNNANGTGWATSTVNVNNSCSSPCTSCYCPTGTPGSWTWGSAVKCGSACTGGGVAGQFVTITASHTASPLFPTYQLTYDGAISRSAIVETQ